MLWVPAARLLLVQAAVRLFAGFNDAFARDNASATGFVLRA